MRVLTMIVAMTPFLVTAPAMAQYRDDQASRYLIDERFMFPGASNADIEKLRTARYGLREPDDDYFEPATDEMRFRWKLNRVKMRVPFDMSGLR